MASDLRDPQGYALRAIAELVAAGNPAMIRAIARKGFKFVPDGKGSGALVPAERTGGGGEGPRSGGRTPWTRRGLSENSGGGAMTYAFDLAPRCGAKTRSGGACKCPALKGRARCKLHGGRSTGPRTAEGLARSKRSTWVHGFYSAEAREERREAREVAAAISALLAGSQP
jgi:hypothetical protein